MSIDGIYDPDNIFAKILKGEIPNATVYEDDRVLSFMDAFPQSSGHTLIIPKAPSRNLLDTDADTLSYVIQKAQIIAEAVQKAFDPDGIQLIQYNGAQAGQTVFHLHFHIIPRYSGDRLSAHGSGQMADSVLLTQHAKKIRDALTGDETK